MGVTIARPRIPNQARHSIAPDHHREPRCSSSRVTTPARIEQDSTQLLRLTPRHGNPSLVELAYRLVGPADAPVVVVQGGISASRAACALSNALQPDPWWPQIVGDGLAINTLRVRVLSLEWLTPADYTPTDVNGADRPPRAVTTDDQADALAALLSELGIERIVAYVGSSYGGMVALAFAARYPSLLGRLVVISAAHAAHPYSVALRVIQRRIVRLGLDRGVPDQALALSRQLAMTTFRTPEEFVERFGDAELNESGEFTSDVIDYLDAVGEKFAARFDPEQFLALSESIDIHAVEPSAIATPCTLVCVTSDRLIYPEQLRELAQRLTGPCDFHEIDSPYGHDAFLKETPTISQIVNGALTF